MIYIDPINYCYENKEIVPMVLSNVNLKRFEKFEQTINKHLVFNGN